MENELEVRFTFVRLPVFVNRVNFAFKKYNNPWSGTCGQARTTFVVDSRFDQKSHCGGLRRVHVRHVIFRMASNFYRVWI